ncbi:MAG: hypothetical protein HQM09_12295 [Candidatus Riflebacteria bacterium]|nr:hypothetical protein [Candidatus Riflebacteria bacterium]
MKRRSVMSRSGMAIVIALFFAFCLFILFVGMYATNKSVTGHNRLGLQNQQAFFAARAALQHLLLKAKLFPTELYDAVEFAQGKNPLFDFTEYPQMILGELAFQAFPAEPKFFQRIKPSTELTMNGLPKYTYINFQDRPEVYIRIGSFYNPDFRFLVPNCAVSSPESRRYTVPDISAYKSKKPEKFLQYFIRDCTNGEMDGKVVQPALVFNKSSAVKTTKDWRMTDDGCPYTMSYGIYKDEKKPDELGIKVGSLKDLRRYNEEAIEIHVYGTIEDFQGKKYTLLQTKIQKITRKGALD